MAIIKIETTIEEQQQVIEALKQCEDKVVPVSEIALKAGLSQSRTRYVLVDLIESGKIERIAAKAFNKHYTRYKYRVL